MEENQGIEEMAVRKDELNPDHGTIPKDFSSSAMEGIWTKLVEVRRQDALDNHKGPYCSYLPFRVAYSP